MISKFYIPLVLLTFFFQREAIGQQIPPIEICEDCLKEVFQVTFKATKKALPPSHLDSVNFTLKVFSEVTAKGLLYLGDSEYISVFDGLDTLKAGKFTPKTELEAPFARYLIPVVLKKGENAFEVKMSQNDKKYFTVVPKLVLGADIEDVVPLYYLQNENARTVNLICILLLCLLLAFSLYHFILLRNKVYGVYGCYLFSILLFLFLFSDEYLQWHFLLPYNLDKYGALNIIPQGIVYAAYTEFGIALLGLKKRDKWLFKVSRVFQVLIIILTTSHALYLILSGGDQDFIFKYFYKVYLVLTVLSTYITFYIIFKFKDSLKWFLVLGGLVIGIAVAIEVINVFVLGIPKPRDFYYTLPNGFLHFSFLEISYVIESLVFLMAINYGNLRKERENVALREKVIQQLQEKELLEKEVNELLQDKLKSSQQKLNLEKLITENERNKSQLMQSQLHSLQLQMNPHYLFNSLNSINDFIISKQPEEASEYLALYARMMRNILRNSDKTFNTLEQELQFSEDYLKLESLRFEGRFEYVIIRPRNLSVLENKLPGMMLQPILENAVWHGIMPLKRKGSIVLDASQSSVNEVIIEISDNGNGILNLEAEPLAESYGLKNVKNKIDLLFKLYQKKISFEMTNLENKEGLKVRFVFPEMEH